MGNCFGKQKPDNFSGAGRTTNQPPVAKPIPATTTKPKYAPTPTQGRTVGGSSTTTSDNDPRSAAARAAEERLKASAGKGKLGKQLDAQKKSNALADASRETRLARDADANAEARTWN